MTTRTYNVSVYLGRDECVGETQLHELPMPGMAVMVWGRKYVLDECVKREQHGDVACEKWRGHRHAAFEPRFTLTEAAELVHMALSTHGHSPTRDDVKGVVSAWIVQKQRDRFEGVDFDVDHHSMFQ